MKQIDLNELYRDPNENSSKQYENANKVTLQYLKNRVGINDQVLDIGRLSPLTEEIKKNILTGKGEIFNTDGDLDIDFFIPESKNANKKFDIIIFSHTIEHLFNPLYSLLRIKEVMDENSKLYVILPQRPKFLWTKGHFHEIDDYRMKLLIERAELDIVSIENKRYCRAFYEYFKGIRPFFRMFLEKNGYYELKLKANSIK